MGFAYVNEIKEKLGTDMISLLTSIFTNSEGLYFPGVDSARFRADHPDWMDLLDQHRRDSWLIEHSRKHPENIRVTGYALPFIESDHASELIQSMNAAYDYFRSYYREHLHVPVELKTVCADLNLNNREALEVFAYLKDIGHWWSGVYDDPNRTKYSMCIYEDVLRKENLSEQLYVRYESFLHAGKQASAPLLKNIFGIDSNRFNNSQAFSDEYVSSQRIKEMRAINRGDFDLSRLIQLCVELNYAHQSKSYLSIAMILRTIINHVPPVFGMRSFQQVVSSYSGGTSFKKLMERLEGSLRNVADKDLHKMVSKKEILPEFTRVDFRAEIDTLLSEIIEIMHH